MWYGPRMTLSDEDFDRYTHLLVGAPAVSTARNLLGQFERDHPEITPEERVEARQIARHRLGMEPSKPDPGC